MPRFDEPGARCCVGPWLQQWPAESTAALVAIAGSRIVQRRLPHTPCSASVFVFTLQGNPATLALACSTGSAIAAVTFGRCGSEAIQLERSPVPGSVSGVQRFLLPATDHGTKGGRCGG